MASIDNALPTFDNSLITVIYVIGGPGVGKGTQCANLAKDFGFSHLCAGDLLRAEQNREGSQYGEFIRTHIREGTIVPMEITIKLLENAMKAELEKGREGEGWANGKGRFLLDGFPRMKDSAVKFEETVCLASKVLFFTTTEEVMLARVLERGKTSGREDDNVESIKKRFRTYANDTVPVIEYYASQDKFTQIDSTASIEQVYETAKDAVQKFFSQKDQSAYN